MFNSSLATERYVVSKEHFINALKGCQPNAKYIDKDLSDDMILHIISSCINYSHANSLNFTVGFIFKKHFLNGQQLSLTVSQSSQKIITFFFKLVLITQIS